MEYAAEARKRQQLSLEFGAVPAGSLRLELRDPHYRELKLTADRPGRWTAALPQDGNYQIWVVRSSAESGMSSYSLARLLLRMDPCPFEVRQLLYGRRPHAYRILSTIKKETAYFLHIRARSGMRKRPTDADLAYYH